MQTILLVVVLFLAPTTTLAAEVPITAEPAVAPMPTATAREPTDPLLNQWTVRWLPYFALVILGCGLTRGVIAAMKALDRARPVPDTHAHSWLCRFEQAFLSSPTIDSKPGSPPQDDDYWHGAVLGLIELLAYPVLMSTNHWPFIGAWLTFKTAGQWRMWSRRRSPFNRFLIGNAFEIVWALVILTPYVVLRGQ